MKLDLTGREFGSWTVLRRDGKKGYWICRCVCGTEKPVQSSHLHHGKGQGCINCWQSKNKTEDLTNKKFEKWRVIERDKKRSDLDFWFCVCECGRQRSVYGSHLRLGNTVCCRKCSETKHKGRLNSRLWSRMLHGAKKRNIEVDLGETEDAKEFLYDLLYKHQECKCALTGLPIGIANTIKGDWHGETTASVDRINSNKGYTKDNVQWVHKWINKMKWQLDQEEFITFCEAVVRHKRGDINEYMDSETSSKE